MTNVIPFPTGISDSPGDDPIIEALIDRRMDADNYSSMLQKVQCLTKGTTYAPEEITANGLAQLNSVANLVQFFTTFNLRIYFDEFAQKTILVGVPQSRLLDDDAVLSLRIAMDAVKLRFHKDWLWDFLKALALENRINPLLEGMNRTKWDCIPRIATALIRNFGAEDSEYVREVSRKWFIGAVRRLRNPGCQFDNVLTLVGAQGLKKSTYLRNLAYDSLFTDNLLIGADSKVVLEQTGGKWIVELAELNGKSRQEDEAVKAFITRRCDEARKAFKHERTEVPRHFVLTATTNKDKPLRDISGNRRWWIVHCHKKCDIDELIAERGQLWAEAAHAEAEGEDHWLCSKLEAAAADVQAGSMRETPLHELLEERLSTALEEYPDNVFIPDAAIYAILNLDDVTRRTVGHKEVIETVAKKHGFHPCRPAATSPRVRGFLRGRVETVLVASTAHDSFRGLSLTEYNEMRARERSFD